jgi:hypothetical protein
MSLTPQPRPPLHPTQVWFVTPEFPQPTKHLTKDQHVALLRRTIAQMQPKVIPGLGVSRT